MKNLWTSILGISRGVLFSIAGVIAVLGLMFYRLVSLTPGFSSIEIAVYNSASSVSAITNNVVNAPYKTAILISTKIFEPAFGLRFVGALIGAFSVIIFYLLVRKLYGNIVGLATTAMFATSSLLLGMSRTATPTIMLLSLLAIVGVGAYVKFGKRKDLGLILLAITVALSLYVPGILIFIVAIFIWQFKDIKKAFEKTKHPIVIAISIAFGLITIPLLIGLIRNPELWKEFLGFSNTFDPFMIMVKYSYAAIASIFVISPIDSAFWLGRQPVLDVFATAMFVYGAYSLIKSYKLDRLWLIIGAVAISIAWIGVTTNRYGLIILLPFVYIVVGAGIRMLTDKWFSVFPKNPIARYVGSILMLVAVLVSINFQLHRYFVAWPNHEATRQSFTEQLPSPRQ